MTERSILLSILLVHTLCEKISTCTHVIEQVWTSFISILCKFMSLLTVSCTPKFTYIDRSCFVSRLSMAILSIGTRSRRCNRRIVSVKRPTNHFNMRINTHFCFFRRLLSRFCNTIRVLLHETRCRIHEKKGSFLTVQTNVLRFQSGASKGGYCLKSSPYIDIELFL